MSAPSCWNRKKRDCIVSPHCTWITGKGCRPSPINSPISRPIVPPRNRKSKQRVSKSVQPLRSPISEYRYIHRENNSSFGDRLLWHIHTNDYVIKSKPSKQVDKSSFSYLLITSGLILSQSEKIKLGNGIEKVLNRFIEYESDFHDMKTKNKKGEKERDSIWVHGPSKTIVYGEFKTNLNLDTEKSKETANKVRTIHKELLKEYPDYTIESYLVGLRYLTKADMPSTIVKKYRILGRGLVGINGFLSHLGLETFTSEEEYNHFVAELARAMFFTIE